MECINIIRLPENYENNSDMEGLIEYIAGEGNNKFTEKLLKVKGRGVSSDPYKAVRQMIIVQKIFGKDTERRLYHIVVSFPEQMKDKAVISKVADKISDILFEDYQVFYGIHTSTENIHIHYAVNAVSYRTGRKWHQNKNEFKEMKCYMRKSVKNYLKKCKN